MAFLAADEMAALEATLSFVDESPGVDDRLRTACLPPQGRQQEPTGDSAVADSFVDDEMAAFQAALSFVDDFPGSSHVAAGAPSLLDVEMELPLEDATDSQSVSSSAPSPPPSRDLHTSPDRLHPQRSAQKTGKHTRPSKTARRKPAKKLLRKSWAAGDSNRARNERRIEVAYLRDKVAQLEAELESLQHQHGSPANLRDSRKPSERDGGDRDRDSFTATVAVQSAWQPVATRQRQRREEAEIENARLKLVLESQLKAAKSMQGLLLKRAKHQMLECSRVASLEKTAACSGTRKMDYHAELDDVQDLVASLEAAYRDMDTVFSTNGLASMEVTHRDTQMREGEDGIYLDVFANKVLPFELDRTAETVWNHFKGSDKHGEHCKMLEKTSKILDESDTIVEDFAKELNVGSTRAVFRVRQILRRYVERDRVAVVYVAVKSPLESADKSFAGLTFRHQCYAVVKRPKASTASPDARSLLQMCSLVSLEGEERPENDPTAMGALTKFMMGAAANSITSSQELIENVLMDQTLAQCS